MFKKAKCRNTSPKQRVCRFLITEQPCQTPLTDLVWGVTEGVHRIEEFSLFIGQSSPLRTEWGLMHVNPWFIKKWIDLLLQSITVIKILATLLLPPPSPAPKWKVELKDTETDRDSKHARRARLHQEEEKKPASPPFRALRHHFWEVLLRQLTSSFRLLLQMCGFPAQWAPAALALFQVPLCDSNKRRSWKPSATAQL